MEKKIRQYLDRQQERRFSLVPFVHDGRRVYVHYETMQLDSASDVLMVSIFRDVYDAASIVDCQMEDGEAIIQTPKGTRHVPGFHRIQPQSAEHLLSRMMQVAH